MKLKFHHSVRRRNSRNAFEFAILQYMLSVHFKDLYEINVDKSSKQEAHGPRRSPEKPV